jgi:hypothetical protein
MRLFKKLKELTPYGWRPDVVKPEGIWLSITLRPNASYFPGFIRYIINLFKKKEEV